MKDGTKEIKEEIEGVEKDFSDSIKEAEKSLQEVKTDQEAEKPVEEIKTEDPPPQPSS